MFKILLIISVVICAIMVAIVGIFLTSTINELKDAINDTFNGSDSIEIKAKNVNVSQNRIDVDDGK